MNRPKKFSVQKATHDFSSKINGIINSTFCQHAMAGHPCFVLSNGNRAVCGKRIRECYSGVPTEKASTDKYTYKRKQKENAA